MNRFFASTTGFVAIVGLTSSFQSFINSGVVSLRNEKNSIYSSSISENDKRAIEGNFLNSKKRVQSDAYEFFDTELEIAETEYYKPIYDFFDATEEF